MNLNEPESPHLSPTADAILHERRSLLLGVLALFGFQLVIVFTAEFQDGLDQTEQRVHLLAITLVAIALAALVTPAAYLRQAHPSGVIQVTRRSLVTAMFSLAIAVPCEFFLAACVILRGPIAIALGIAALVMFFAMWFVLPLIRRPH